MSSGSEIGVVFSSNCWKSFTENDSPLHLASWEGNVNSVKLLLESNAAVNERNPLGCSPLRLAASAGHKECVQLLIQYGADTNLPDVKAQTPLIMAVKNRHIDCVRALLEAGANPEGDSRSWFSPLFLAAMDGLTEAAVELLNYGADPDTSKLCLGKFDSTPTCISLVYNHVNCFRTLLAAGADPDGTAWGRIEGPTPGFASLYHVAVKHSASVECVELLRACGASVYRKDSKGRFACDIVDIDNAASQLIRQYLSTPLSLQSSCRVAIRRKLSHKCFKLIEQLTILPHSLRQFLNLDNV